MNNKDFILEVQKSCHLDMPQCLMLLGSLQKMMAKAAIDHIPVMLNGLGVFTSHKHPEYIQEDPKTGAVTLYPPRISYRMQSDTAIDAILPDVSLAEFAKVSVETASSFVEALVSTIKKYLSSGEEIEVPGLGVFQNIHTHHSEFQHVTYLPSANMKELVNAPFNCFDPIIVGEATVTETECKDKVSDSSHEPDDSETEQQSQSLPSYLSAEPETVEDNPSMVEKNSSLAEAINKEEENSLKKQEKDNSMKKQEKDNSMKKQEKEESINGLLYGSVALILLGCGLLVWLMLGNDIGIGREKSEIGFSHDESEIGFSHEESTIAEIISESLPDELVITESEEDSIPTENVIQEKVIEKTSEKIDKTEAASIAETKEFHRLKDVNGMYKTITLQPGERLTLVALNLFGDKSFWPYIFDANSDKLKAPNLVQAGMTLYLPDPAYYGIDANDPESVRKAKNRAAQLLK